MMQELAAEQFERARPLFQGFDYSLSVQAAIEGNNPGRIFVDDGEKPRTAFALTVEGYLLAGAYDNPVTNEAIRLLWRDKIFSGEVYINGDDSMALAIQPLAWEALLPELIPTHEAEKNHRYHYLCRALKFDWRSSIPEGYRVRRIDMSMLDDAFPNAVRNWIDIEEMWWTVDNFLQQAVSFAVLYEGEIVSWCTPDCVAGDRIDVGIITHPTHRRQGLASIAAAATVEQCLNQGFSAVGWHCNASNVGSWKTAEKVGFERNRDYVYYYYMYDPIDHLAELGYHNYLQGNYARTVQYYEQAFAQRDEHPDYYYHLAASAWALLDNKERALYYLTAAVDHGWSNSNWTEQRKEFSILYDTPEWHHLLARMEGAQDGLARDN